MTSSISKNTPSSANARRCPRVTASVSTARRSLFTIPSTGREILTLAGLLPAENYTLRMKMAGEKPRKVGLDEKVDLRQPGVEKFKALPRDQTEG